MKRIFSTILALVLTLALMLPSAALAEEETLSAKAQGIVRQLYDGEYASVFDASTPEVQAGVGTADGFAAAMAQLTQVYGAFEGITGSSAQEQAGYLVALVTCAHANADITYSVVLDSAGLLAGFTVSGVAAKASPGVADTSAFATEEIILRAGEADETQGLLTLPTGDGPFPAVIMMQGSGPSDMNETAYGIAIFRDLAEGLASAGLASIRYDKYTYAHKDLLAADPDLYARFTVNEEYILDAQAALALLQSDARIGDIYLLGHSEGAMLAPRVMLALGADHLAGAVLLAGSPLHLWELQYHQNLAVAERLSEPDKAAVLQQIEAEAAKKDALMAMTANELKQTTFFGVSAYYQADEMAVDAAQTAIALGKPLFIAQGAKDWQVTPADGIEAWQAALADSAFAAYALYPNLNHLLVDMDGDPTGTTADYQAGSAVSQELIDDIAAWILGR